MRWYVDIGIGALAAVGVIAVVQAAFPNRSASAAATVSQTRWLGPTKPPAMAPTLAAAAADGQEIAFWEPAPGHPVISPFGYRKLPWEARGRLHQGVDIAAPSGSFVRLIADGVVIGSGEAPGYGRFVEVEHANQLRSFYAHLSAIAPYAKPGAPLRAGAPIGAVGSTGSSTGAHLHLEVSHAGRPLNPAYFIGRTYKAGAPLPLSEAGRIPAGVRIASVSRIPQSKRELMAARDEARMAPRVIRAISVPGPAVAAGGAERGEPAAEGQGGAPAAATTPDAALSQAGPAGADGRG